MTESVTDTADTAAADYPRPERLTGRRWSQTQVSGWIDVAARRCPDRACLVTPERSLTFAEVLGHVRALASALQRRGLRAGERVAILDTDSPEYIETILAVLKLGAVIVPLNYRLAPGEIETLLRAAEATWIVVGERYVPAVLEMAPRLDYLHGVVGFDGTPGTLAYTDLLSEGAGGELVEARVEEEDILALAFTSGTTGLPKGVMQSQRMWKHITSNSMLEYRFTWDEFRYSGSPLFHVAGMNQVLKAICRGSTSLLLRQWDPAALLPWFRRGLTGVFLVPTMLSALLDQPGVSREDFAALRSMYYGAAPMSPALLRRAMDLMDVDFFNGFGAGTEAGMQSVLTPEDHRRALAGQTHLLGSVGRPGHDIDLRIVDDDGSELPPGEVGEIVTRSDMTMSGYAGQPEKTAGTFSDGWFSGGDLGHLDEEGYLYLDGRKSDMIIRGGENVYPPEIEEVLGVHPGVAECAVVGRPDDYWGEIVEAHLVPAPGAVLDPEELAGFCRARLARYKVPERYRLHDDPLPKNAAGKVLRRVLRELP
ncbi:long-chain fatty acid--CoA ligase [Pseudonocardia ailaonensis]|uniref:Long-chain fatty acid--CoA ligase n=1 Tax=Pseudonocardia ailaonensis TaxID=367279 RepID=A0ABN2N332_9PSEU